MELTVFQFKVGKARWMPISKHEQYETHKTVTKLKRELKETGTRPRNTGDE